MRVLHVITGLDVGGAEAMLVKLLETMDRDRFSPSVISLLPGGLNREAVVRMGIPVHDANMTHRVPGPRALVRLSRLARRIAPDLVQGWMYHGNLAAAWARYRAPGGPALVWNIRHSLEDIRREKVRTRAVIRLGATLSGRPGAVVCNSRVAMGQHAAVGYDPDCMVMIPNGFDLERFRPDPEARREVRAELGITDEAPLVGIMARRHPMKGHADFLRMATEVASGRDARFLMVGRGVDDPDGELDALAGVPVLADRVHRLGSRTDMPRIMAALDVLVVASVYGEGFPNVLGEAMSCGVPCVTTDVGDAAEVVGELGRVVAPGRPDEMAAAVGGVLDLREGDREQLGTCCRESIRTRFSLVAIARRYETLYQSTRS